MIKKIIRRRAYQPIENTLSPLPVLDRIYKGRGIQSASQLEHVLANLARPGELHCIDIAVDLIYRALRENGHICIIGDFDADGATSTALAVRCLRRMGAANVSYLVPNRFEYGYGLTPEIVEVAAQRSPDLIITVDNGISSVEGVARAREKGIKVLVTDHHLPGNRLPDADAIVNPNQPDCGFPSKNLAGVGVIFYVMSALRKKLDEENWFTLRGIDKPNMAGFLDLVALGTVADVVQLDFNNRILVAQGLQRIRAGKCIPGILALMRVANRSLEKIVASDFGFAVGPRLNAAGRLDDMSLGIRCLLTDSQAEALAIARELDDLNRDRRLIEASMQQEAMKILGDFPLDGQQNWPNGLCLFKEDWHQGVIGILASRVKDRLHRPTIVFASDDNDGLKGSGRSVPGIHLRDVLDLVAARNPGLLTRFGGHAMAAGLSIEKANLAAFQHAFDECVTRCLDATGLQAELLSDGELREEEFCLELALQIRSGGPWGQAFPEPLFDGGFRLLQKRVVGEKHLKMLVTPNEYSGIVLDAIAFHADVGFWSGSDIQHVVMAYKLDINEYRGDQSLQLIVDYMEPLEGAGA